MITEETRREAHERVDKHKRQAEIVHELLLHPNGLTAKECACALYGRGLIPSMERNYTAPRLTELVSMGIVVVSGKRKCAWTDRTVAVYAAKL